jgi:hypothetical protein
MLLLLLTGAFAFASCSKETEVEDPFTGRDSYITAFSLKQGELVFNAAIIDREIVVTVPEGFSLMQAQAMVKLSENATIYPDPANITDWNEERQFAVTAYNSGQIKYKYTVKYSGFAHDGTVVLATQADVEAFGLQGVTLIDGSLTIGRATGADSITSLAPLAELRDVTYNIILNPTCAITGLEGLEALRHVGGTFQIGALKHLETLTLPGLITVGNFNLKNSVTFIAEFPELANVVKLFSMDCPLYQLQLPSLQSAGSLTLTNSSNTGSSLEKIALPALEEVIEVLSISFFHSLKRIEMPVLKKAFATAFSYMNRLSLIYAPRLEEVTGVRALNDMQVKGVHLANLPDLTEFILSELKKVGTIYIESEALNLLGFPKLTQAVSLDLRGMYATVLDEFPALQTVGTIALHNPRNASVLKLPASIQHVERFLVGNSSITIPPPAEINVKGKNIDVLEIQRNAVKAKLVGDDVFHGTLVINSQDANTPFPGFPLTEGFHELDSLNVNSAGADTVILSGIRKVTGGAYLATTYYNSPKFFRLPDLEEVGSALSINFSAMLSATGPAFEVEKLKRVGGNLIMNVVTGLVETMSFPELTAVGGNFDLNSGFDLYSYIGFENLSFPKLATVGGKLNIYSQVPYYYNQRLKNLDGFAALTRVGAIEISGLETLESYEGLKELFKTLPEESWITPTYNGYNPSWQDLKNGKWTGE